MKFPPLLLVLMLCGGITAAAADSNDVPHFKIEGYVVSDTVVVPSMNGTPVLSPYTGTNAGVEEIARAATDLRADYSHRGFPGISVVVGERGMTNDMVVMQVVRSAVPQIVIFGKRYSVSAGLVADISEVPAALVNKPARRPRPPTPEQEVLRQKMTEMSNAERSVHYPPQPPLTSQLVLAPKMFAGTNSADILNHRMEELQRESRRAQLFPPRSNSWVSAGTNEKVFEIRGYEVTGNTLLSSNVVDLVLQPYIGTNVTVQAILAARNDLQAVYTERGFATVSVTVPAKQTLDTNNPVVKIRVFEGRIEEINVVGNHYFSSNNVRRALPGLHPDMILVRPSFEAELDRANANQDRQIYPALEPGVLEGTSALRLDVKDRLPLHGKIELNNQNSPGTPDVRLNSSAAFNNLWQMEHSLGVQYSFSPEQYKNNADSFPFYDRPLVANYGGFYRLPIGSPEAVDQLVAQNPSFGYDEATHKFNLPAPSGRAELNFFASRSSIDTAVESLSRQTLYNTNGNSLVRQDFQRDLTQNEDLGARLTVPSRSSANFQSGFSGGIDFKTYQLTSFKTNVFTLKQVEVDKTGGGKPVTNIIVSVLRNPDPSNGVKQTSLEYLPLSLRYDAGWRGSFGTVSLGLGLTHNLWVSSSPHTNSVRQITGSKQSNSQWTIFNPSIASDILIHTNWILSLRLDGQISTEPLISNEQFGAGGVNSVRGYHEGEVFGDNGIHTSIEIKTPPHTVGMVYGNKALVIRESAFLDYADVYLIDPQGRPQTTELWGVGAGLVGTVGSHFDMRFLFAVPLEATPSTPFGAPHFNFALTSQF